MGNSTTQYLPRILGLMQGCEYRLGNSSCIDFQGKLLQAF